MNAGRCADKLLAKPLNKDAIMKKRLYLVLSIVSLMLLFNVYALAAASNVYDNFIAHHSIYRGIVMYFNYARETMSTYSFGYRDLIFMISVDLPLSLLFLWMGLHSLSGRRKLEIKSYLWFLFAVNIGRFLSFLFFYLMWIIFKNSVIVLKPQWEAPFLDVFSMYAISMFFVVYVWLLARTFELEFFGALKVFFVSHILYCAVAALAVFAIPDNRVASFIDKNMGLKPIIQGYLRDVGKISQGDNAFSLIRIRTYHM